MAKETSEEVAAIAAAYVGMTDKELYEKLDNATAEELLDMVHEIQSIAASCLSQRSDADD